MSNLKDVKHPIGKDQAIKMTTRFRENREHVLEHGFRGRDVLPVSETFNRAAIERLLALNGCEGIRIYYGMDENFLIHAILVGVNANNEDILSTSGTTLDTTMTANTLLSTDSTTSDPATDPATDPTTDPATDPTTDPTLDPTTDPIEENALRCPPICSTSELNP